MTTQTQTTISVYEDNAGGIFMTDGQIAVRIADPDPGCMAQDVNTFADWASDVHYNDVVHPAYLTDLTLIAHQTDNVTEFYHDKMGGAGRLYAPAELVEIPAGTLIKIDRKQEGQYLLLNSAGANAWVSEIPGYYHQWTLSEPSDGLETVQDWLDKGKFKGRCPCVYGPSAIDEGYGPWFSLDTDLVGEVAHD